MSVTRYHQGSEIQTPFRDDFVRVPYPLGIIHQYRLFPLAIIACLPGDVCRQPHYCLISSLQSSTMQFYDFTLKSSSHLWLLTRSPKIGHDCECQTAQPRSVETQQSHPDHHELKCRCYLTTQLGGDSSSALPNPCIDPR